VHPEEQYAVRTLKAGASGYLTKESAPDELIAAIRKVSVGKKYVSSSLAEKLAFDLEIDREKPPHETLSDREYQVMCMITSGRTVKDIAEELFLSEKTISTYRTRILEKMKMKSNIELTHYAIKHGLVE
jgi:DNA-binding NarL/FixJ family response regulator